MIRALYHHGDERPASDLTARQIESALNDPAGVLWVDLDTAERAAAETLLAAVFHRPRAEIEILAADRAGAGLYAADDSVAWIVHRAERGAVPGPALAPVAAILGANFLVTCHPGACPPVDGLFAAAAADGSPLVGGADLLAARALRALAEEALSEADRLVSEGGVPGIADRDLPRRGAADRWPAARPHLLALERAIASQRTVTGRLATESLPAVRPASRLYFRVAADRLSVAAAAVEDAAAWAAAGGESLQLATLRSLRDGVRALVVVQSVFAPLLALVALYAMRAAGPPPIRWSAGWSVVFVVMALVAIVPLAVLAFSRRL
jgi:Mg2+ and Co2+ transporter CorA